MYYSVKKSFFIALALIATNSAILVIIAPFSTLFSRASSVQNESSQVDRIEKVKELFNKGNQQYQKNQYSQAEESLKTALKILNDDRSGFEAPRTRPKRVPFLGFKISLPREIFGNALIPAIPGFNINVNTSLDELYVSILNNLNQRNNQDTVLNNGYEKNTINYNNQLATTILYCSWRGKDKKECNEIDQIYNPKDTNQLHQNQDVINNIEDEHEIEIKILKLLQRALINQDSIKKKKLAFKIAQRSRNLEFLKTIPVLVYALNNEVIKKGKTTDNELSQFVAPKEISIKKFKKISSQEKATLVYYSIVSPQEIFVWVVQPTGNIFFEKISLLSLDKTLKVATNNALKSASSVIDRGEQSKLLIQAIRDLNLRYAGGTNINNKNIKDFTVSRNEQKQNLQQLYKILITPIEKFLPKKHDSHVVIIPPGPLLLVPFSALQDTSEKYLIEKHTIRIAPNLHNLTQKRSSLQKMPEPNEILLIGNPTNPDTSKLPGAEREAARIGTLLRTSPLIRSQAQKEVVKQRMLNKKIIHFATHGILDRQKNSPFDDVILLITSFKKYTVVNRIMAASSYNKGNHKLWYRSWKHKGRNIEKHLIRTNGSLPGAIVLANDSFTSQEILNFKLKADLVVLSACNTGRGITGDSIVLGLPLSFGLAGVSRVIVSLWAVPDVPTQKLMFEFYAEMAKQQNREGKKIDEVQALRQAMLKIKDMEEYRDPIHWAGFTLMDVSYQRKN